MKLKSSQSGFTLIELLVVMAIVGLLSSTILLSLNQSRAKSRDTKRKGDLAQLQKALELYYNTNNSYPVQASMSGYSATGCTGSFGLTGASGYIPSLAPTFVGSLPADPKPLPSACSGYEYKSDGINYKIISTNNSTTVGGGPETLPSVGEAFYDPA